MDAKPTALQRLGQALARVAKRLNRTPTRNKRYRPEQHYLRGAGPKSRERTGKS
jgi:hypothetical protein